VSSHLVVYGRSETGKVRAENQDCFAIVELDDTRTLCVVADGMGGHMGGEIASALAVETITKAFEGPAADADKLGARLDRAFRSAHDVIRVRAMTDPGTLFGMGTTCVAAHLDGARLRWAHVGDSRLYLHDAAGLRLMTRDHSKVQEMVDAGLITSEEARHHPERNVITMALGATPIAEVARNDEPLELRSGERVLLCTDGLSGMLADAEIESILGRETEVDAACDALVEAALEAGGEDNVTVVIAGL